MLTVSVVSTLLLLAVLYFPSPSHASQSRAGGRSLLTEPQSDTQTGSDAQSSEQSAQTAGKWVLIFKQEADAAALQALCIEAEAASQGRFSGRCTRLYTGSVMKGISGSFTAADIQLIKTLFQDSLLAVEKDGTIRVDQESSSAPPPPPPLAEYQSSSSSPNPNRSTPPLQQQSSSANPEEAEEQTTGSPASETSSLGSASPPWGLDLIDQHTLPLDRVYHYSSLGSGVNVYMIDTGIKFSHQEFGHMDGMSGSRAIPGFSVFGDNNSSDCYGHGTHTAATVGGLTFGVAKNATLVAVRALDCSGEASYSDIIMALQWVADNVQYPAIVSTSIAGEHSAAVNQAVQSLIDDYGITVVAAAGNDAEDACGRSPAGAPGVIAAGAVDSQIRRWYTSNWGSCVAVHAPGVNIVSAGLATDTAYAVKTGTSMAAPHVTGVAALYLETNPGASPGDVKAQLVASATEDVILDDPAGAASLSGSVPNQLDIKSTPNLLLYSMLNNQGVLSPSVIDVSSTAATSFMLSLSAEPNQDVHISIQSPTAAWNPSQALAAINPGKLTFSTASWQLPQQVSVIPSGISIGDWFINITYSSSDRFYDGTYQTVRMNNDQTLTGDTVANPRAIPSLPFSVTDGIARFSDSLVHPCAKSAGSSNVGTSGPEVIYSYTPRISTNVDINTCNSTFAAVIYIFTNPDDLASYTCADSQVTCSSSDDIGWSNGMSDVRLFGGITYYIAVEGSEENMGDYKLSMTESPALQSS